MAQNFAIGACTNGRQVRALLDWQTIGVHAHPSDDGDDSCASNALPGKSQYQRLELFIAELLVPTDARCHFAAYRSQ